MKNLDRYKILLASKSPRRHELLAMLDIPFEIAPSVEVEEVYPSEIPLNKVPLYLSVLKAQAYSSFIKSNELIITADTVVINNGKILGKPSDIDMAEHMLREMSGHPHTVVTGVCLTSKDKQVSFDVSTQVKFAPLTEEEITYYVRKYKPFDKAGAYGIQEWIGAAAVEAIEGCFYNVMGLPVHQLYLKLRDF